jgi:hypothetical protein
MATPLQSLWSQLIEIPSLFWFGRLVLFLSKLILNRENVVEILRSQGLRILVDLVTLAHLHTSRAVVPTQTQVLTCYLETVFCIRNDFFRIWIQLSRWFRIL